MNITVWGSHMSTIKWGSLTLPNKLQNNSHHYGNLDYIINKLTIKLATHLWTLFV